MFVFEKLKSYFTTSQDVCSQPSTPLFYQIMTEANNPSQDRICSGYLKQFEIHYLGVFDGHGSSKVSQLLYDSIQSVLTRTLINYNSDSQNFQNNMGSIFRAIFNTLEKKTLQLMAREAKQNSNIFENCGSCALLAIVTKTNIHIANLGDSQGLLINNNPQNSSLTNPQMNTKSKMQLQKLKSKFPYDDQLLIAHNDSLYIKGKLNVTASIGDFSLKYKKPTGKILERMRVPYVSADPDIKSYQIVENDRYLLLASDGLWDMMEPREVAEVIEQNTKDSCLQALVNRCYQICAQKNGMRVEEIMSHPKKREFIDDISIVLLDLTQRL